LTGKAPEAADECSATALASLNHRHARAIQWVILGRRIPYAVIENTSTLNAVLPNVRL
jgi:hypothetical protein